MWNTEQRYIIFLSRSIIWESECSCGPKLQIVQFHRLRSLKIVLMATLRLNLSHALWWCQRIWEYCRLIKYKKVKLFNSYIQLYSYYSSYLSIVQFFVLEQGVGINQNSRIYICILYIYTVYNMNNLGFILRLYIMITKLY